ncbi:MAG: hypothetical protein DRJ31_10605 [Candidatus Methanomethylicota archaeon]|uniref:Uncharacterized protein n=1 Tax=Thermoproteota archaeon TaxID=2056631 RepID=A0A497EK26_9CREN|nr:MAG: hypothetical protein DRJ31_10605 [Candidatus Verstraetearchaeota archaeon]
MVVVRKRKVYEVPARHHGSEAKELAIKEVWKSRKAYLKKQLEEAFFHLGRALHYIHDSCLERGLFFDRHDEVEKALDELSKETIEDEKAVVEYFEKPIEDPIQLEKLRSDTEAESKADKARIKASQLTGQVAASILLNKPCPQSYIEEHKKLSFQNAQTFKYCGDKLNSSLSLFQRSLSIFF